MLIGNINSYFYITAQSKMMTYVTPTDDGITAGTLASSLHPSIITIVAIVVGVVLATSQTREAAALLFLEAAT